MTNDEPSGLAGGTPLSRQSRHGRLIATGTAVMFIPGVLIGQFGKEDRVSVLAGSLVLLVVAWFPRKWWPFARFMSTTVTGTCLAFAGIVGLQAPAAASAWLFGAAFAGIGRYWADSLLRSASEREAAQLRQQLEQINDAMKQRSQEAPRASAYLLPATLVAAVAGMALGFSAHRARTK